MPQVAIAQPGSCANTSRNALSPSLRQNEWSNATERCNCGWTAAEQELAKDTVPSLSAVSARAGEIVRAVTAAATAMRAIDLDIDPSPDDAPPMSALNYHSDGRSHGNL